MNKFNKILLIKNFVLIILENGIFLNEFINNIRYKVKVKIINHFLN